MCRSRSCRTTTEACSAHRNGCATHAIEAFVSLTSADYTDAPALYAIQMWIQKKSGSSYEGDMEAEMPA